MLQPACAAGGLHALSHEQVHAQAKAALQAGMETLSQAEVGSALQIYFNLNELPQVCQFPASSVASSLGRLPQRL